MAEVGHGTKIRHNQGGDVLVIDGAGGGQVVPATETLPALVANPTDLATALTAIIALRDILKATGFMAQA
jgi:hypothetical protein